MYKQKLTEQSAGCTLPLKDGINVNELMKELPQELELCMDDLDDHYDDVHMCNNKTYFDNASKFSFLLDCDEEDKDDGNEISWFWRICSSMKNIRDDGGVRKSIKKEGVGATVTPNSRVSIHYSGFLEDLDEPFDSSQLRNTALQVTLGKGEVIAGLDIGISTMRKHEIARFFIEPSYGYGKFGCPPRIPPNAPIMFQVELLNFSNCTILENLDEMTMEDRKNLSFERVLVLANNIKMEGNQLFAQQNFGKAIKRYMKLINIMETVHMSNEKQEEDSVQMCLKAYVNMALCNLKLGNFGKAICAGKKVLGWNKDHVKALYICGKSLRHMGEFLNARSYLVRALKQKPSSKDIAFEFQKLDQLQMRFMHVEKTMCQKMFKSCQ